MSTWRTSVSRCLCSARPKGGDARLLGTIDYVAPEQIAGDEDLWPGGCLLVRCVLYECLVGQPPFRANSDVAVVFAHLESESPEASIGKPSYRLALDAVSTAKALAKVYQISATRAAGRSRMPLSRSWSMRRPVLLLTSPPVPLRAGVISATSRTS